MSAFSSCANKCARQRRRLGVHRRTPREQLLRPSHLDPLQVLDELLGQVRADLNTSPGRQAQRVIAILAGTAHACRVPHARTSRMRCANERGSMVSVSPVYGFSSSCVSCAVRRGGSAVWRARPRRLSKQGFQRRKAVARHSTHSTHQAQQLAQEVVAADLRPLAGARNRVLQKRARLRRRLDVRPQTNQGVGFAPRASTYSATAPCSGSSRTCTPAAWRRRAA